jgi:hypothetical protein
MTLSNGNVQCSSILVAANNTNTATGMLTVAGGNVNLDTSLFVGSALVSTGQVIVNGGTICVSSASATAVLSVPSGTVSFNAGTITTDNLLLTNSAGQFIFNGGTLNARATSVSNGAAFVVGNGLAGATLHLNGGTNVFANGLVISANARLEGCGTIVGSIVNNGTIATNCSPQIVAPRISAITKAGATATVSFASVIGQTYTLEFKNALTGSIWTAAGPSSNGCGGVISLIDAAASAPSRFYHVRTQ